MWVGGHIRTVISKTALAAAHRRNIVMGTVVGSTAFRRSSAEYGGLTMALRNSVGPMLKTLAVTIRNAVRME